jgi:hypothetical protein
VALGVWAQNKKLPSKQEKKAAPDILKKLLTEPEELRSARTDYQRIKRPSEQDRQRYILSLASIWEKFAKDGQTSAWQAVEAEMIAHPSPVDADSNFLSKILIGEWDSPRHGYVYRGNGTWSMLPDDPETTKGSWSIKGNQYFDPSKSKNPNSRPYIIILLTSTNFIKTDGQKVFFMNRRNKR